LAAVMGGIRIDIFILGYPHQKLHANLGSNRSTSTSRRDLGLGNNAWAFLRILV
jgi:hypothetical protein